MGTYTGTVIGSRSVLKELLQKEGPLALCVVPPKECPRTSEHALLSVCSSVRWRA